MRAKGLIVQLVRKKGNTKVTKCKLNRVNITQRQGIIKVVPKKRKNRLYLENWRPISLLNIDYKIATKTIADGISKVLPKLIHEDQTGYVKGRYIGQNIRVVKDIMKVTSLDFLTYYGLCNSIPQKWIRLLKQSNPNTSTNSEYVGKIPLSKLSCKSASRVFVSQKFEPPTAERRMLQVNLDRQAISTIYSIPFKVTKDMRLTIFQYKIVHRILPTNATLFRDKIAQHDKCHLCDQKQTMNHLFVSCPDVQIFWQSFSRWWNVQNDDFIVLNDETIIYGFTNDFSQQLGLNLCLIIAKYYIYCASRNG